MFKPDNNLNSDQSPDIDSHENLENIDADISSESVDVRQKQLEGLFTKLIIFGLALGTVLGFGAYYLLNKFGLTKKPDRLKQEQIELEKQPQTPVDEIRASPIPNVDGNRFEI